ncbi:hypothetical protein OCU04_012694 [Sclerotinia nivalis]|uniref:Rhodopsin domain-containing protein n=2 Tax=Sclerotinia nivalis TaxID=352851 RepID=A0A9X0A943_9HELO|nr:hypothetical protein OCU04_012694 [Sclerotinia nivalis]KAJ8058510.1 hypothetical protein OCU04_012694 [Sclerotinia nivalis]
MTVYSPASIIAIAVVFSVLPSLGVSLRIWARKIKNVPLGIDDYLILPALFCTIFVNVTLIVSVVKGEHGSHQKLGPHGELIHDSALDVYQKTRLIMEAVTFPALGFTKVSLLFLYKRIFAVRAFRLICWVLIVLASLWATLFFFLIIFQCHPVSIFWTKFEFQYGDSCFQTIPFYESTTYTDFLLDILILALPIPMIWKLQLPLKQKIAVSFVFLLGTFVLFAGIVRLVLFFQLAPNVKLHYKDITFYTPPIFVWCAIENGMAVLSACLPTLRPLFVGDKSLFSLHALNTMNSWRSRLLGSKNSSRSGAVEDTYHRQTSSDGDQYPLSKSGGGEEYNLDGINKTVTYKVTTV